MIDKVFLEIMQDVSEAISSNQKQKMKVESTGNQKAIDNWRGQELGLTHALHIIVEARTRYLNDLADLKKEKRAVKKTLTIPAYLNELGENNNINFSQTLQEAIKKELGI
jgi:hypothetical protein